MTTHSPADAGLDRAARRLHADALANVPGPLLLRLQSRRTRSAAPSRALGWGLGAAFAAVFAVAIGLQGGPEPAPEAPLARLEPSRPSPATDVATAEAVDQALVALDEDPDLYLWLASADAQPLAME